MSSITDDLGISADLREQVKKAWASWGKSVLGVDEETSQVLQDLLGATMPAHEEPVALPPGSCMRRNMDGEWQVFSFDPNLTVALGIKLPTQEQLDRWWHQGDLVCPAGEVWERRVHPMNLERAQISSGQLLVARYTDEVIPFTRGEAARSSLGLSRPSIQRSLEAGVKGVAIAHPPNSEVSWSFDNDPVMPWTVEVEWRGRTYKEDPFWVSCSHHLRWWMPFNYPGDLEILWTDQVG